MATTSWVKAERRPELDRLLELELALRRARLERDRLEAVEVTSGASYLEGAVRCGVLRVRLRLGRARARRRQQGHDRHRVG